MNYIYVLGMAMRIFLAMRIDSDMSDISDICRIYPTYVGNIRHMLDFIAPHFSDRQPFCIRMAIPSSDMSDLQQQNILIDNKINLKSFVH